MFPSTADVVDWFENCEFLASLPRDISPEIRELCDVLDADAPVVVQVEPTPDAELMKCFSNVKDAVADGLGDVQTGWLIWEFPGVYLVAERHAVLQTNDGLLDITPQPEGYRRVLFAATPTPLPTEYTPCRYVALKDHPLVHRFVELMSRNQILSGMGQFRSAEFHRNDAEAARSLRNFLALERKRQSRKQTKDRRSKRKAERQRRRRSRR